MRDAPLAGTVQALAVCSPRPGRFDLFLGAFDGQVWQKTVDSTHGWTSHGHPRGDWRSSARADWLAVTSSSSGRMQLLARDDETQRIWRREGEDDSWSEWTAQSSSAEAPFPADGPVEGHEFLFSDEGRVEHRPRGQRGWSDLGGYITGGRSHVAVVPSPSGGVDVFAMWAGGAIMRRSLGADWSDWELVAMLAAPAALYTLVRTPDLVALRVSGEGFREQTNSDGTPEWALSGDRGRLFVDFPPQHIAETVLESGTASAARLAGPSRLQFVVAGNERVELSSQGVLRAMATFPIETEAAAGGEASVLELPWRLRLRLERDARCVHRQASMPDAHGLTELWHTHVLGRGRTYAGVHPFASLALEVPFADHTPLQDKVQAIAEEGAGDPKPVPVQRLILSSLGAWFSAAAVWLDLSWTHKSSLGRDFYVRVAQSGVLFPFGHRAAVIQTTERRFDTGPSPIAGLRQTWTLVVAEPHKEYPVDAPHARAFPFQFVDIEPVLVTQLDEPPGGARAFWPKRGSEPVVFTIRGTVASEVISMQLPLLFTTGAPADVLDSMFAGGPRAARGVSERPRAFVGRFMPIAVKRSLEPLEGAVQQVRSLTFAGRADTGGGAFHPEIAGLEVELPAVNQLLGAMAPLAATLSPELLSSPPSAAPDVLLDFPSRRLNFGSAKTGVVAAPSIDVSRVSRTRGAIAATLPTDPAALFGPDAKLLGAVPLSAIISQLSSPPTVTWTDGANPTAHMQWAQGLARGSAPFIPKENCAVTLDVASAVVAGRPTVTTKGVVTNFALVIPSPTNPLVTVDFKELRFEARTGALPTPSFEIKSASFGGSLQFVQELSKSLPKVGNSGPRIDITPTQIKAVFAIGIPSVPMGAFMLRDLLLQAGITLSLINRPVTIDFSFGTRAKPFLVTVMGFGGGGYLELGIGAGEGDGLQRFVGGIEFGASVAMDFGVAAGEVHVFGGVVFAKTPAGIEITGYLRIGGMVRVLGLISVSIELTVSLTFVEPNILKGAAKLVIAVDLTFWSTSVEISCEKSFAGSSPVGGAASLPGAPLTVADAFGPIGDLFPWQTYCRAFAGE